jgi:hypothetical protein
MPAASQQFSASVILCEAKDPNRSMAAMQTRNRLIHTEAHE